MGLALRGQGAGGTCALSGRRQKQRTTAGCVQAERTPEPWRRPRASPWQDPENPWLEPTGRTLDDLEILDFICKTSFTK